MKFTICLFALFSTLLLFTNCSERLHQDTSSSQVETSANQIESSTQMVDGKCYERCFNTSPYLTEIEEIAVFTGNSREEDVDLEHRIIEAPTNQGYNSTDELPNAKEYVILKDTSQSPNFVLRQIFVQKKATEEDQYTMKRVVCQSNINSTLIGKVQQGLRTNGYYDHPTNTSVMDNQTLTALRAFKKQRSLSCGDRLDVETLELLGISLEKKYTEYNW